MPIISFLTSILIGWVVGPKWIVEEVEKNGEHFSKSRYVQLLDPVYCAGCHAGSFPGIDRVY